MKAIKHIQSNWKNISLILLLILVIFLGIVQISNLNMYSYQNYYSQNQDIADESIISDRETSLYYSLNDFSPEIENRQISKNAQLTIELQSYAIDKEQIKNYISERNGFILNENENNYENSLKINYLTIKVNSIIIDEVITHLQTYGETQFLSVQTQDITQQFQDYSKRIERIEYQIIQYEEMLKSENLEIEDEINIQNRITQLEDQLFYITKNLNSLNSTVKYSQISLTLQEKPTYFEQINFLTFKDTTRIFLNSIEFALRFLVSIAGFIIPFALIYFIYRIGRKLV